VAKLRTAKITSSEHKCTSCCGYTGTVLKSQTKCTIACAFFSHCQYTSLTRTLTEHYVTLETAYMNFLEASRHSLQYTGLHNHSRPSGHEAWTWGMDTNTGAKNLVFPCTVRHGTTQSSNRVMKTNLMHCLSSVYFVIQPVNVSGILVAHHQEVCCIYRTICPTDRQSTKKHNTYQSLYIYSTPPDDVLQICPKHVEFDWRNKLRKNSASSWFSLHGFI